jgi:hypothetical protein
VHPLEVHCSAHPNLPSFKLIFFWIFKMPAFSRLAVAVQLLAVIVAPVLGAAAKPQYDYVIVGGGVTGLIVANRITEDKSSMYYDTLIVREVLTQIDRDCSCCRSW